MYDLVTSCINLCLQEGIALAKAVLRQTPIGSDRNHSRYWVFSQTTPGLYIEKGQLCQILVVLNKGGGVGICYKLHISKICLPFPRMLIMRCEILLITYFLSFLITNL